jgi:peptidoglycan/xylan/chitin deacetylase (PgdA/CDA1 family)
MAWGLFIFGALVIVILAYTVIPNFILKTLGLGTWKNQDISSAALTFDDGPNPEITPQILDILDQNGITATFFLVGERASRNPELVKMIKERGHQLGIHSNRHQFAWLMSPWKTWRDWEECNTTLECLTGDKILLARPPWGTFNLCTWLWMKRHHKQIVLWSTEGHDWQSKRSPQQITDRVLKNIRPGAIILLHDAGGDEGAPQNTLQALNELCNKIVQMKKIPLSGLELMKENK